LVDILFFQGQCLIQKGGWKDYAGSFDTIEEAEYFKERLTYDDDDGDYWADVIDTENVHVIDTHSAMYNIMKYSVS